MGNLITIANYYEDGFFCTQNVYLFLHDLKRSGSLKIADSHAQA